MNLTICRCDYSSRAAPTTSAAHNGAGSTVCVCPKHTQGYAYSTAATVPGMLPSILPTYSRLSIADCQRGKAYQLQKSMPTRNDN